jgi:hypothetical protein
MRQARFNTGCRSVSSRNHSVRFNWVCVCGGAGARHAIARLTKKHDDDDGTCSHSRSKEFRRRASPQRTTMFMRCEPGSQAVGLHDV